MPTDGRVLFAYDGSEQAKQAIAEAGDQLRTGRPAIVLAVWEPIEAIPFWGAPMSRVPSSLTEQIEKEAQTIAAEGAELAKSVGFEAEPAVTEGSPVWRAIVEAAEERSASLIALGSHGRSEIGYAAMGSVATSVAHHAKVPVLICRQAG